MANLDKPLKGMKVVELSMHVAAPLCGQLLGYLGADVIKIETPKGDPYRRTGGDYGIIATEDENPLYDTVNSYKRSIALNLRSEEGMEILKKLIKEGNVFISNYRPSALASMGLSFEDIQAINPKMVYGVMTGYGTKGIDASRAAFDSTAYYGRGGFMNAAQQVGLPPMITPAASGDTVSATFMAFGIMAGYTQMQRTGIGCRVDSALMACALWVTQATATVNQFRAPTWKPRPYNPVDPGWTAVCTDYECKCGTWIRICVMVVEQHWEKLCRALGIEELIDDPKFNTMTGQVKNRVECFAILKEKFKEKTYAEWEPIFREYDLPIEGEIRADHAIKDQQAIDNDFACKMEYTTRDDVWMAMPPFKISTMEDTKRNHAPKLGADTAAVLAELGYTAEEIDKFAEDKAIICRKA